MMPDILYHYCDVSTFMKIVESRELWLSNATKMNDYLETVWINHIIDKSLQSIEQPKYKEFTEQFVIHYNANQSSVRPYIFCLSADGDMLSQWRGYADDGRGIAIGISTKQLNIEMKLPYTGVNSNLSTGLFPCVYDEIAQGELVRKVLSQGIEIYNKNPQDPRNVGTSLIETAPRLRMFSFVFKNPSFAEEMEWRIIHTPMILAKENDFTYWGSNSEVFFRNRGNDIVSYFKYDLKSIFNTDLIPEIILGPKSSIEQNDFRLYLQANNLCKTVVKYSKSTYR
ncbi:MAG: DUF2971 domain-containing protein [Bacteroidota bacterium]|nr:DUF2971 domain-containing protein [Bacteroidota bacterium]